MLISFRCCSDLERGRYDLFAREPRSFVTYKAKFDVATLAAPITTLRVVIIASLINDNSISTFVLALIFFVENETWVELFTRDAIVCIIHEKTRRTLNAFVGLGAHTFSTCRMALVTNALGSYPLKVLSICALRNLAFSSNEEIPCFSYLSKIIWSIKISTSLAL